MTSKPILVGYDGSSVADVALDWALTEAAHQQATVRLVFVCEWDGVVTPVPFGVGLPDALIREEARAILDEAIARASTARPEVTVVGDLVDGRVTPTLCELSEQARLLVLGSRGLGGFAGLLAGSVAVGVATHAKCPVVVVRGEVSPERPIVVGVDESPTSQDTIDFALGQAAKRGVDLVAVRAWEPPPVPWRAQSGPPSYDAGQVEAAQRELAERVLEGWHDKHPEVSITIRMIPGTAAHALVTASAEAQLVVVGSRGRGGFRGLLLGSVARQLIDHGHCPVAVVHPAGQRS